MGKCLVEKASDQDKQTLVKWIFFAISLNPAIKPLSNITADQRSQSNKDLAKMFEHLVGESCLKESQQALKYEGNQAFSNSFQLLGQIAGREVFTSPEVDAGTSEFTKYLDIPGLQKKLGLPAK
jgi:hypothetical protein